ncbi:hypothetical protein V7S43_015773 [Phytophthora oleae]|uniref:Uncharacterized protein n=1 Tax=Phytophthora oleae TaxID=2107226 RepID=A0ABD3EZ94_9STRA
MVIFLLVHSWLKLQVQVGHCIHRFQAVFFNSPSALTAFIGAAVVLAAVSVIWDSCLLLDRYRPSSWSSTPVVLRVKSVGQFVARLLMFGIGIGALALTTLHHVHCDAS